MKKTGLLIVSMLAGVALTLMVVFIAPSRSLLAVFSNANRPAARSTSVRPISTSTPTPPAVSITENAQQLAPSSTAGDDEVLPPTLVMRPETMNVLPTPVPGESLVYFVPTDNDATATVLYLYNTDTVAHIVALRGFSYNGILVYSLNINVGATSFLRLASDALAAAPPPSWATPAPIITNFTDFTYFASLSRSH